MSVFYIVWGAVLFVGDTLAWATADYFWNHDLMRWGDVSFWLVWVISSISIAKMVLEKWNNPRAVWASAAVIMIVAAILIFARNRNETPAPSPQPTQTTNEPQLWQPSELPSNCDSVSVFFGAMGFAYPRQMAEISPDGTKFPIKDLPDVFTKDLDKNPHYSSRQRDMWLKYSQSISFNGQMVLYPVQPVITNNRLYVEVEIPFLNEKRKIVMNDAFDSEVPIPNNWDRNYSTNRCAYEIVNDLTNPVLQVIYTAPNEVHVNGIFDVGGGQILASFGQEPRMETLKVTFFEQTNYAAVTNAPGYFDSVILPTNTTLETFGQMLTNELYRPILPGQKAIFKYPSNRNPGVFADWLHPPRVSLPKPKAPRVLISK
jgi:hypothetical protein